MYKIKMVICAVILHLTLVSIVTSQATLVDYCAVMCQGQNSSTVCQNLVTKYDPENNKRALMNFYCCFTNELVPTHYNYFDDVSIVFKLVIIQERGQEMLNDYAECVRRCAIPGKRLSTADCEAHIKSKYSKCERKTCLKQ